jgi:hypothetical protein
MIEKTANIHWILAAKREYPLSKALVSAAESTAACGPPRRSF